MPENNSWSSPDGTTPEQPSIPPVPAAPGGYGPVSTPAVPPAAGWATPVAAGGNPQGGAGQPPQYTPGPQAGWTPPPKPGLIPLQPLTLGAILAGSFQVIRRNPRPTFGASLVINGIVAVITILVTSAVAYFAFDRVTMAASDDLNDILAGSSAISIVSGGVTFVLTLFSTAILQGIISLEVARATVGEKLRLSALWALAKPRIGVLIGWSLLIVAAVGLAMGIVVTLLVLIFMSGTTTGYVSGVLLAILAFAIAIALAIWLGTKLSLVPSVLFLERAPLLTAIRRSWFLTSGNAHFWRTFGIQILVTVIVTTAAQIVVLPVTVIVTIVSTLGNPNADLAVIDDSFYWTFAVTTVITSLVGSLTAIIITASTSLIYIDLRMRREGLDLTLARFVEARQVGDTSVADPYLPVAADGAPRA